MLLIWVNLTCQVFLGSDDLVTGYENLICMSLKACNEALNWPRVLNQLDAISATSIAITLADIVENR